MESQSNSSLSEDEGESKYDSSRTHSIIISDPQSIQAINHDQDEGGAHSDEEGDEMQEEPSSKNSQQKKGKMMTDEYNEDTAAGWPVYRQYL